MDYTTVWVILLLLAAGLYALFLMQAVENDRFKSWTDMATHLGLTFVDKDLSRGTTMLLEGDFRGRAARCIYQPGADYDPSETNIRWPIHARRSFELNLSYQVLFKNTSWRQQLFGEPYVAQLDPELEAKFAIDSRPANLWPRFIAQPGIRDRLLAFQGPIEVHLYDRRISSAQFNTDEEKEITPYFHLLADLSDALEAVDQAWPEP